MRHRRQIDAHDLGMWPFEQREKAVAQSRGGIDIETTVDAGESVISAGNDFEFRIIGALVFVTEQWDRSSPAQCPKNFRHGPLKLRFENDAGKERATTGQTVIPDLPSTCPAGAYCCQRADTIRAGERPNTGT